MAVISVGRSAQLGARGVGFVRVYGVDALIAKFRAINVIANLELGFMTRAVAEYIEATTKSNINSVTGNLASGTKANRIGPFDWGVTMSSMAGSVAGKNNKEYGGFVEFGTSKMAARAPLRLAANSARPLITAAVQDLARRLERV